MWDRKMWGIELWIGAGETGKEYVGLLGGGWNGREAERARYEGEPTRVLVFRTRKQARDYCVKKHLEYKDHPVCGRWRFCPVRVRETVRVI